MIFVTLLALAFASEHLLEKEFYEFKMKHNKNYSTWEEHEKRLGIYKANKIKIQAHNDQKRSWTMAMNQFGDMTGYEFSMYVKRGAGGGYVPKKESERKVQHHKYNATCDSIDWDARGMITPVKNQGQCGSCWSFSTTGAIEGRYAISSGQLASLSEQELVDCDQNDSGCNGGLMDFGFEYVIQHKGLCSEVQYPYTSGSTTQRGTCESYECTNRFDAISSYADVPSDNQEALESALCDGPVSIAIEADQEYFQFYSSGVLDGTGCGANLDHGVLLVGMGTDPTYGDYWKVKNSWGTTWGDAGYIRMCRNCGMNNGAGQCGLMKQPSYPVV